MEWYCTQHMENECMLLCKISHASNRLANIMKFAREQQSNQSRANVLRQFRYMSQRSIYLLHTVINIVKYTHSEIMTTFVVITVIAV